MPLSRLTVLEFGQTALEAADGVTRSGSYGELIAASSGSGGVSVTTATEYTFGPNSAATGTPQASRSFGFLIRPSNLTPDTPPGFVVFPAQDVILTFAVTSTPSNQLALGAGSVTPRMSVWILNPAGTNPALSLNYASGPAVATRGLTAGNPQVSVQISRTVLPVGWVIYVQIGGLFSAPQPAVGSNTEQYTIDWAATSLQFTQAPFVLFDRDAPDSTAIVDSALRRVSASRRVAEATAITDQARRIVSARRTTADSAPTPVDVAQRIARFPRATSEQMDAVANTSARRALFRRVTEDQLTPLADVARRVTAVRRITEQPLEVQADALKKVTYGRRVRYQFQPGDEPLVDPTKQISGVIRNADGTPYLEEALVVLMRNDHAFIDSQLSSPVDGSYSFARNSYDAQGYYVIAWSRTAVGDPMLFRQAVSERGLVPLAV